MASKFQSRLVGTIILVAVGVIILPDVLDGEKLHYREEFATIPIKPDLDSEVENFEILEPVEDTMALPESPVVTTVTSKDGAAKDKPSKEEVTVAVQSVDEKNSYQDSGWIIQLMALRNAENAQNMVKDLQKRGYQAHTIQENGFTRVVIGPDVSKSKLERQILELEKITGSKGQLLKFRPLNP